MFAKTIVLSDAFLDMPLGARCLYMTMGMVADDDGFVNSPKAIIRQTGATEDDLKILIAKRFVIPFESGVIVIKHWRINNYLQKDRVQPTKYQEELGQLLVEKNGAYTECIHDVYTENVYTDKNSIDKDSIDKNIYIVGEPTTEKPKKDSYMEKVEEILNYLNGKTGKKFTSRSKSSVKMIKDRLREGYVVDEFKAVIDNKTAAWGNNPDMKVYLRPETLFRPSHFDSYLNDVEDEKARQKRKAEEIDAKQNANYGSHWTDHFFDAEQV